MDLETYRNKLENILLVLFWHEASLTFNMTLLYLLIALHKLFVWHEFPNRIYLIANLSAVRSIVDDKFWHWKCERWLHDWTSTHAIQNAKGYWQLVETQLKDLQLWKIRVCDLKKKYYVCTWLSWTMEFLLQWSEVCGAKKDPLPLPLTYRVYH